MTRPQNSKCELNFWHASSNVHTPWQTMMSNKSITYGLRQKLIIRTVTFVSVEVCTEGISSRSHRKWKKQMPSVVIAAPQKLQLGEVAP